MVAEENVYEQTPETGDIAAAKGGAGEKEERQKDASTVLGKFKDVDALARAYGALEAEFTRRSQRLKELEREAENLRLEKGGEGSGAEKLRKNAKSRKVEEKAFDEFVADVAKRAEGKSDGDAEDKEGPAEKETPENTSAQDEGETLAMAQTALKEEGQCAAQKDASSTAQSSGETLVAGGENAEISSEALLGLVSRNENVRLQIIGEYLRSISRAGAPLTAGGGVLATPPQKAKSIDDAALMALRYFKNVPQS